jgi:prephenate dehydrogenase (NADP+)
MAPIDLVGTMDGFTIGVIGMGDMGKMYARRLSAAGWK